MEDRTPGPTSATSDYVITRVRAFMAASDWSPGKYAREAGLRDSTLRFMLTPDWNPTVETLRKLEAVIPADWKSGDPAPPPAKSEAA